MFQLGSVYRVLEPIIDKINEKANLLVALTSRLGIRSPRSEWFRVYRVSLPICAIAQVILMPRTGFLLAI